MFIHNKSKLLIAILGYSLVALLLAHELPAAISLGIALGYFAISLMIAQAWKVLHGLVWPSLLLFSLVPVFQSGTINLETLIAYYEQRSFRSLHVSYYLYVVVYLPLIYLIATINYYELLKASCLSRHREVLLPVLRLLLPIFDFRQRVMERYSGVAESLAYRGINITQPIHALGRIPIWLPILIRSVILDAVDRANYLTARGIDISRYRPTVQKLAPMRTRTVDSILMIGIASVLLLVALESSK